MKRKYELTSESIVVGGHTLYRIKALREFGNVKAGDLGGFVESESNLSHDGNAWVYNNARVFGNAWVYDNAIVYGNAMVNFNVEKNTDFVTFGFFGAENRTITISTNHDIVNCGCFSGTLEQFKQAVDLKYNGTGNYYTAIKMIESICY